MKKIVGISGSLRKSSYNTSLLNAAVELAPEGCVIEVGTIEGIPLYNADEEEANGAPEAVTKLRDQIANADGLLLCSPEYNFGIPGVFKNAMDWVSRPLGEPANVFKEKAVALVGASPGGFGTINSQNAWHQVFRNLGVKLYLGHLLHVSRAMDVFDENGNLTSEETQKRLKDYLEGFAAFV